MSKSKFYSRIGAILVLIAIGCTACDVPDISEFSKQSAEMTRGIRKGIKDTEGLIKTASERDDLYSAATRTELKKSLKKYQANIKPTVASLDALDGYLDALNALAKANKKSEENSRAVVTSVGNLVNAVSGLNFAGTGVNVATALLTEFEEFRTARDFKKRVNLAAEIVEGKYVEKRSPEGQTVRNAKGDPILVKACAGNAKDLITSAGKQTNMLMDNILQRAHLTESQTNNLNSHTPQERREILRGWGKMTSAEYGQLQSAELQISRLGCGVIDLIKFNVEDLKVINGALSQSLATGVRNKRQTTLDYYEAINTSDTRVQGELTQILKFGELVSSISDLETNDGSADTIQQFKVRLKTSFDDLFAVDPQLRNSIGDAIAQCGVKFCGHMNWFIDFKLCPGCDAHLVAIINQISPAQFDRGVGIVQQVLEQRASALGDRNSRFLKDLDRITPAHTAAVAEIKDIVDKQSALDAVLETSISALDTWSETHANLRVSLNTRKPLSVAKLTSKVREIWAIVEPDKKESGH